MRQIGRYNVDDPAKIQGRDEVFPADRSLAAVRLRHCLDALRDVEGTVLVLGCGAGRYVRALDRERPDLRLVGGDLSVNALHEAAGADHDNPYVALNSNELPFADEAFSAVVFFDLLEHVPGYQRMLHEIRRVLRADGIWHMFVPLEARPWTLYSLLRDSKRIPIHRWKRDHVGHINCFTGDDVLEEIAGCGFDVGQVHYGFHPIGQLHDVIDYWHRERESGGSGVLPLSLVRWITRLTMILTWRLSYLEDRFYGGPRLASGMHVTARRQLVEVPLKTEPEEEPVAVTSVVV
jgi:SAM-dependent methyltransferase